LLRIPADVGVICAGFLAEMAIAASNDWTMPPRRSAAEFPNDNPELHDGLVWVCSTPCAKPIPTLRLRPSERARARLLQPSWVADAEAAPESGAAIVDEPVHASETNHSVDAPPGASSPFEAFVVAMVRVAMAEGASRAASLLPSLLGTTAFEALPSGHPLRESLVKQGILSATTGRLAPSFSRLAAGWWGLLEGAPGDVTALGDSTLDGFGADLLAALVPGATGGRERLRRALRKHGVAAFGMLAAA